MDSIFDALVRAIEENSFPYISPKKEYRQEEQCAERQLEWLRANLSDEEKVHLEQLLGAELRTGIQEHRALIKIALSVGIRLALTC